MKSLVVYTSTTGNTKAVAEYIAKKTDGIAVEAGNVADKDLKSYDAIVLGSQIHAGKISKGLQEFICKNSDVLDGCNVSMFVCGMFTGEKGAKQLDKIAKEYGYDNTAYFVKGKKLVQTGDEIDAFIKKI